MRRGKNLLFALALFFTVFLLAGCGKQSQAAKTDTVTVGSHTSDLDIWQHIAKSKQAKELGLTIKIKQPAMVKLMLMPFNPYRIWKLITSKILREN
ncbi:hypothetical protein FD29_GL000815 [Companilactobacillus mindensis DSM 14500]|uniref:Uncharacterized protein n=1 Tax=Companilactobacillus mindensis DSM 14500 TaxID=1423770 RepID=A0A0R1QUJ4_9LACO|nr:hypothetical protein FD29_GL000815 [Companilactobacillus mindensis DSM 14500]GEO78304.1 hypothetical protein LMI01_06350 [Companilactobacillus mindensis]